MRSITFYRVRRPEPSSCFIIRTGRFIVELGRVGLCKVWCSAQKFNPIEPRVAADVSEHSQTGPLSGTDVESHNNKRQTKQPSREQSSIGEAHEQPDKHAEGTEQVRGAGMVVHGWSSRTPVFSPCSIFTSASVSARLNTARSSR